MHDSCRTLLGLTRQSIRFEGVLRRLMDARVQPAHDANVGWRTIDCLTQTGRGLIAAPMINAATIFVARRRRTSAVWADARV
jgi:hypothetical protein